MTSLQVNIRDAHVVYAGSPVIDFQLQSRGVHAVLLHVGYEVEHLAVFGLLILIRCLTVVYNYVVVLHAFVYRKLHLYIAVSVQSEHGGHFLHGSLLGIEPLVALLPGLEVHRVVVIAAPRHVQQLYLGADLVGTVVQLVSVLVDVGCLQVWEPGVVQVREVLAHILSPSNENRVARRLPYYTSLPSLRLLDGDGYRLGVSGGRTRRVDVGARCRDDDGL